VILLVLGLLLFLVLDLLLYTIVIRLTMIFSVILVLFFLSSSLAAPKRMIKGHTELQHLRIHR
jgi:hypothetical protein